MKGKRALAAALLALALAGAQSAALRFAGGGRWPLALPLVVVIWLALEAELLEGAVGAAAAGFVLDALGGAPGGLLTGLAVALFLLARLARGTLALHGDAGFAVLAAGGTLLVGLGAMLIARATVARAAAPGLGTLWRVALEAVLTGLAAALLHRPLRRLGRWLEGEPDRAWPRSLP